jgi:hypothetical protein
MQGYLYPSLVSSRGYREGYKNSRWITYNYGNAASNVHVYTDFTCIEFDCANIMLNDDNAFLYCYNI